MHHSLRIKDNFPVMQRRVVLFGIVSLVAVAVGVTKAAAMPGGWEPIKNVSDPHIQEIGEYAVSEYDKRAKAELKYENVEGGETQVVSGINYRLVVKAMDGTTAKNYEAVVWEKPWLKYRNLTSFKPVKV
ncbi:hypothetical protein K2173_009921 [Erythroxylum novogranatense]|uniref:Cystatin domain-containing protein n=1 Tax=Erythroxylum novogranatense TaxID=1862640 RepID=A0AAV8SZB1_9ROSI|nr:hypothetical protein K2173_009921 [Erythroxylum novogranatense]